MKLFLLLSFANVIEPPVFNDSFEDPPELPIFVNSFELHPCFYDPPCPD